MSEWWTYRPSDFLMFSPRIYGRLFESLNEAWWPAQPVLVGLALVGLAWLWRSPPTPGAPALRLALVVLGAGWLLSAWVFLHLRLAPIFWVAGDAAMAFGVQGLALMAAGAAGALQPIGPGPRRWAAAGLCLWAALGHPLVAWAAGRPWLQAEVVGLAPDPTVMAMLAVLLGSQSRTVAARWLWRGLWVLPVLWLAFSALMLATMGATVQAAVLLAVAVLAVAALRAHRH